jgi:hypothetical protein
MIWRRRIAAHRRAKGSKDLTPLLETSLMLGRREQADGACVQDDDGRVGAQLWVLEHSQLAAAPGILGRSSPEHRGVGAL